MRRHRVTEEEKVALKIANLVNDLRIDLELAGAYFARSSMQVSQNRLQIFAESAKAEREQVESGIQQYPLW